MEKIYCYTCRFRDKKYSSLTGKEFYRFYQKDEELAIHLCTHINNTRYTITPIKIIKKYKDCFEVNKNNDCKYYEMWIF